MKTQATIRFSADARRLLWCLLLTAEGLVPRPASAQFGPPRAFSATDLGVNTSGGLTNDNPPIALGRTAGTATLGARAKVFNPGQAAGTGELPIVPNGSEDDRHIESDAYRVRDGSTVAGRIRSAPVLWILSPNPSFSDIWHLPIPNCLYSLGEVRSAYRRTAVGSCSDGGSPPGATITRPLRWIMEYPPRVEFLQTALVGSTGQRAAGAALDINSNGAIVGIQGEGDARRACVFADGQDPMLLGPNLIEARSISDRGQITGVGNFTVDIANQTLSQVRGFLWTWTSSTKGTVVRTLIPNDLAHAEPRYVGSQTRRINVQGQMAGKVEVFQRADGEAALWDATGAHVDLNAVTSGLPAGVRLIDAVDLNDNGDVLAVGRHSDGHQTGFVLKRNLSVALPFSTVGKY
jgi:hypothetical protein